MACYHCERCHECIKHKECVCVTVNPRDVLAVGALLVASVCHLVERTAKRLKTFVDVGSA